jgi:hypothetical protein
MTAPFKVCTEFREFTQTPILIGMHLKMQIVKILSVSQYERKPKAASEAWRKAIP